jgi:ACT domain-containing protein
MSEYTRILDLLAEYRANIRDISITAQNENWTNEKLQFEIERETEKIDKILDAYKVIKDFMK